MTVETPTGAGEQIDPRAFRDAIGRFASGVTVITGHDGTAPIGFTCQSFYSVSVDPLLISISVQKTSTTFPRIRDTGKFAVNVLATEQAGVSQQFAKSGTDKWADIGWEPEPTSGNPLLIGTHLWVDCTIWAEYDAGDHTIVLGQVNSFSGPDWHAGDPLLFHKGRYRDLRPEYEI